MVLDEEIQAKRAEIRSDGYPMSIGELINLYKDGELDIHPEFERFFRWTQEQKSRLIESLLLGIPIPSIFVAQRADGVWDVVDGLQRLSTIFQLVGILKDENGKTVPPLTLTKTKYLPSLQGKKWDGKPHEQIGSDNQLLIKRSKLDMKIILRESSESSKYELFQRLNTGGSPLSDQELRNCILITVNREAYQWLATLSNDPNFQACISLTDRAAAERYDMELVVRFLVFTHQPERSLRDIGDLSEFLTDELVRLVQSPEFDRDFEASRFQFTFSTLATNLGEDSFRKYDPKPRQYTGGFLISAFEVLAMGLGYHALAKYKPGVSLPDFQVVSQSLWANKQFLKKTGSGVRASTRIPFTVPHGRRLLAQ